MSASYVRQKVREWCAEVAATSGIAFHDTVNVKVDPTEETWFTVAFTSEMYEGTFGHADFVEMGFISIIVVARAGACDSAAIAAMEVIVPLLYAKTDPRLTLTNFDPIDEDSLGTAERYYRISVPVNYRLSL